MRLSGRLIQYAQSTLPVAPTPEFHDKVKRNTLKWQEQQNPSDSLYWFKMVSSMEITFSNLKYSAKCICLSRELVLREGRR